MLLKFSIQCILYLCEGGRSVSQQITALILADILDFFQAFFKHGFVDASAAAVILLD